MKIIFAVLSYLLGSVPTGYLLVRWTGHKDVRDLGSGSTGATNVLRVKGLTTALPQSWHRTGRAGWDPRRGCPATAPPR